MVGKGTSSAVRSCRASPQAKGAGHLPNPGPRPGSAPGSFRAPGFPLLGRTGLTLGSQLLPCVMEQATEASLGPCLDEWLEWEGAIPRSP